MALFNDVFNDDAFGFLSLTEGVSNLPFVESALGQTGLFDGFTEGIETDTVVIDEQDGQIQILSNISRGAPPERMFKDTKKKARAIIVPHHQIEDRISAASLFGKRKFGQSELESVAEKVNDKFTKMMANTLEPTKEVQRLGALRGQLIDSDGVTVIHDYFQIFQVAQIVIDLALSNATTNVREEVVSIIRQVEDELGGVPFTGVEALCGRDFFDEFISHPKVRDTYLNQESSQGDHLRSDLRKTGFMFGGILWKEYRGMRGLANDLGQVNDAEAIVYPVGVSDMYRTYWAPANFLEAVNTLGQPFYAKVAPDWKYNRWVDQLMESNPLYINVRPRAVPRITKS